MSLVELLRFGRWQARMTLAQVSRVTGISVPELSRIENGLRRLSFSTVVSLCDLYRLDIRQAVVAARQSACQSLR